MTAKHTPTPWCAFIKGGTISIEAGTRPKGNLPCVINWPGFDSCELPLKERKANARFIVRAVNSHPALLAALKASVAVEAAKKAVRSFRCESDRLKPGYEKSQAEYMSLRKAMWDAEDEFKRLRAAALSAAEEHPIEKGAAQQ